jgi:signal transduction histidine kinase
LLVETRARSLTRRGQILRVTAVRDVSERHRLEAELRRRETLAAMGSLVAGVAHEVRTPLFSLSATLDALEAGAGTPDQQHELKDLLRSQVRRLANLMQDLLDYGRPPRLKLARAGIGEPVQRAVRSCGALASKSAVGLALDMPEGLPQVDADLGRLEQVFENLLANALQHAPRGSTVRVTVRPTTAPPAGLSCAVEDDGPGLLASDVEHVFEPFFSRRKGGTGMGLAIAHRLVEAHGGALTAGNRAGAGAVFTVFLPAAGESRAGGAVA